MLDVRHCKAAIVLGVAFVVLASAGSAHAQEWLSDRERAEGPGFRVGNLELHPGLAAEGGYDSNVFLENSNRKGSGILRLTGHLLLSTLGAERKEEGEAKQTPETTQMLQFRGGLDVEYYHYFISNLNDNVAGNLSMNMLVNPKGPFTFGLREVFGRTIRPFTDSGAGTISYGRNQNSARLDFGLRSRGGLLSERLSYGIDVDFFDQNIFRYADSYTHVIESALRWRFLPSTAILHDLHVRIQRFYKSQSTSPTHLTNNVRVDTDIGLNGAFTNELSAAALVGYSAGFYKAVDVQDFDSVNARAELRWKPRQNIRTTLGYERDFHPSFVGNYYKSDKLYLKTNLLFVGALLVGADLSAAFTKSGVALSGPTGTMPLLGNQQHRKDTRISAGLFSEYRFTNWLALNATFRYIADVTNYSFQQVFDAMGNPLIPDPSGAYHRFEIWGGLRVFY